ncbi:MAG: hypothetical protein NC124_19255 [Clostridium sp.]|nr:hypothetical protein [Clostridium sp.]
MGKNTLKAIFAMLVMVMLFSFTGITAEAATTKKLTLYVGEQFTYTYSGIGEIKSVKSSKKSVVAAKQTSSKKSVVAAKQTFGKYNEITAKKKGSAIVTVKGTKGTFLSIP